MNKKPYIVAELNSSHRGKIEIAKKMIDAAKECGCDAVKFQSWTAESLYSKSYYDENPIAKRMVNGFSLTPEKLYELSEYCHNIGIDFSSTPYSYEEVDFLVDQCDAAFIKVASMDINNAPFLKYIAKKGKPIILSTGMSTIEEIENAVDIIAREGNIDVCILHCVSLYPVAAKNVNLSNLVLLKEKFPMNSIGYSDHTVGVNVACASVAMGAEVVEKHFTLDNSIIGWDNQMATEPVEMKLLVSACHEVYESLGHKERIVTYDEEEQLLKMRRSIVVTKDLSKGHILSEEDISAKRPGTGIPVSEYYRMIGKKLLSDINKDELLRREMLE